jgi:hypothetical protein
MTAEDEEKHVLSAPGSSVDDMLAMSSDNPFSIPLGIVIGLLASCVQSFGMTIQRKSHVLNQSLPEHLQRVEHRRPYVNLQTVSHILIVSQAYGY